MVSFDSSSNKHTAGRLAQSAERLVHSSAGDRRSYSRGRTNSPGLKNRDTTFIILETARPSHGSDDYTSNSGPSPAADVKWYPYLVLEC